MSARRSRSAALGICATTLIVALITACALPGQESDPVTTYLLEWNEDFAPSSRSGPAPCATLLVTSPLSAPGYATSSMAYVLRDHRLDYFATHRWADTPAHMLAPLITRALQVSGLFKAVVESPAPVNAELRLESEVLELRQVFSDSSSEVQLSLKTDLYDLTQGRVLASRVLSVTEPAPSRDPYGGVIAANRATGHILEELADFLATILADDPLGCR